MTLLTAFCDLSKRRLLISVMSSKGSAKQAKSDINNPEWTNCNSFSSSSNDSAIFCDNGKRGTKRTRNSSGSSASSSLSCVSDKATGSSTTVGQSRHNLRRNIVKKTCDCHCNETHTTYKRTSYERIEKTSPKEGITIARTNIQFRVENNGKKEVHKVTYEKSFSPSKFEGQSSKVCLQNNSAEEVRKIIYKESFSPTKLEYEKSFSPSKFNGHRSEVGEGLCLQNNVTQEVHKVTYKESFSPTKSETYCLGDNGQEFQKLTYEESYSPSKTDSNRKRRSEVQKLYESLHEIEWAKDFSPDNILRQINVRQAASCSLFGRSKPGESPPAKRPIDEQSDAYCLTPVKRPKDELDAPSDSYSLIPIKLEEELNEESDRAPIPAMKPKEEMDALQSPPKGLHEDLCDHQIVTRLKKDIVVKSDALNPVKRLKFDLHDTANSSSPPRLMEDTDNKTEATLPKSPPKQEQDRKSETIESPPSLRMTRSMNDKKKKRQRKVSTRSVVKYEGRRISRRINKISSPGEQNHEDSNLTSVECVKIKKNSGNLKIKKHINFKNSSINCKISSSQEFSGDNLELPDSLSTFIPRMCHGLEADNPEFSLPPIFFDIAEEGIRTIDACFREVGAEVVISTCDEIFTCEADSEIPLLTSVEDSGSSDKAAVADDSPPVLEHCGACQKADPEEFLEKPCQTEATEDCQLENETSDCCEVSHPEEDAKELHLEDETSAISFEIPDQVEEHEYLMLEDGTVFKILGRVEGSDEIQIENENLSTPYENQSQAEDSKDFQLENEILAISSESFDLVEDSKDFQLENETLATSSESFDQVEDSKGFKLENGTLVGSWEIFSQMDDSKEIKTATSCKSAGQREDSENIQLENKTSAVSCDNLGQVHDSKEFQLKIETLATSCESSGLVEDSKDFLLESKSLVKSCEVDDAKDLQLEDETLAKSCDPPGQIKESKELQLEKGTLATTSCEDSENCPADSEISIKSSESPCQTDSTKFQLQNEIPVQTCETYQTGSSTDEQVKRETLLSTCEMPCQIEDKKCRLRFKTRNSACEADRFENCWIENETSGTDYKVQLSEDCNRQSRTLIKTYAKYHDYSFGDHCLKDESPSRSCMTFLEQSSTDLQFDVKDGQKDDSLSDATDFHGIKINSSVFHCVRDETPSRSCLTFLGESSKDLQFDVKDGLKEDSLSDATDFHCVKLNSRSKSIQDKEDSLSDATDFHCVEINSSVMSEINSSVMSEINSSVMSEINSSVMSETGMSYEESSDAGENKSDLESVCSEESVEKRDFSEILKRIVSNRFKNDSLIKQAGKRILNKYLRILRCEERDEISQQFYVSTKDIVSPVKKDNRLGEHKMVEISKQNVYNKCKSPEKLTFNHGKSSFKTYSNNKELIHKNIPNKTLLVQEKNSNFYHKEPVATTHLPPKKDNLSTLPGTSGEKILKIYPSSTLANYRTLLMHRYNDYTQVILRLPHFTIESLNELCDVLRRTDRDPHCHALILNGIGESFGLGIDLRPLLGPGREQAAPAIAHSVKNLIEALSAFKKPLVAVVNGAAHGLAMTILNHADTVIASQKATFCLPQLRFGYFPEGGATYTLPRIVGATRATDLIMRSRVLTAQEALQINLITEVFDEKSLPDDLVSKVKVYMKTSLTGMETAKAMLKMQTRPDLLTMLENEVKLLPQMWLSDSCQEAMARELYL